MTLLLLRPARVDGLISARIARSQGMGVLDRFDLVRDECVTDRWIDCCDSEARSYHAGLGAMVRCASRPGQQLVQLEEQPWSLEIIEALRRLSAAGIWASELSLLRGASWSPSRRAHQVLSEQKALEEARGFSGIFSMSQGSLRLEFHCDGSAAVNHSHRGLDALMAIAAPPT